MSLILTRAGATVDPVSIAYLGEDNSVSNTDLYSALSIDMGAAADDRIIVLGIASSASPADVSHVEVDSEYAAFYGKHDTDNERVSFWGIQKPTGTGNMVINVRFNASTDGMRIAAWRMTGADFIPHDFQSTGEGVNTPPNDAEVTIDVPFGGAVIAMAINRSLTTDSSTAHTWTGAVTDKDYDEPGITTATTDGSSAVSSSDGAVTGSVTLTVTATGTDVHRNPTLAAVSFYPASARDQVVDASGEAYIGNMTANGGLTAIFDGTKSQGEGASGQVLSPTGATAGVDWGSGNDKKISGIEITVPNNSRLDGDTSGRVNITALELYGSTDGSIGSDTLIATFSNLNNEENGQSIFLAVIDNDTAYRAHYVDIDHNGGTKNAIAEIEFTERV